MSHGRRTSLQRSEDAGQERFSDRSCRRGVERRPPSNAGTLLLEYRTVVMVRLQRKWGCHLRQPQPRRRRAGTLLSILAALGLAQQIGEEGGLARGGGLAGQARRNYLGQNGFRMVKVKSR